MRKVKQLLVNVLLSWLTASLFPYAYSHGLMTDPRQRGALVVKNRLVSSLDDSAPFDPFAHFPSGDKTISKGAGKRSVIRGANNLWTPYEPLNKDFSWRAGVCGDELGQVQEHLKGGKYYFPRNDPIRVKTYTQGDVVNFESNIVTHHNGFVEFFICNIDDCGDGDISTDCFRNGYCQQLLRAPSSCDNGNSEECGPIDEKYRGRWYLPCGPYPKGQIVYGGKKGSMRYQLPIELTCDHCVIQWYWTSANTCNPPGVIEYFEGANKPNWRDCKGQGNAIGGYTRVQKPCGGGRFPEEYWQCADVRIVPSGSRNSVPNDNNGKHVKEGGQGQDNDDNSNSVDDNRNGSFAVNVGNIPNGSSSTFESTGKNNEILLENETSGSTKVEDAKTGEGAGPKTNASTTNGPEGSGGGVNSPFTSGDITNIKGVGNFGIPQNEGEGNRVGLRHGTTATAILTPTPRARNHADDGGDVISNGSDNEEPQATRTPSPVVEGVGFKPQKRGSDDLNGMLGPKLGSL